MATDKQIKKIGKAASTVEEQEDVLIDNTPGGDTLLEMFKAEMAQAVAKETKRFKVPGRPNISLEFDVNVDYDTFELWRKKATKGKGEKAELNFKTLSNIVISNTNVGFYLNGTQVPDSSGGWMTVTSDDFYKMVGVPQGMTTTAIKKLYGSDADIVRVTRLVIEAMGYTMDDDEAYEDEDSPLDN